MQISPRGDIFMQRAETFPKSSHLDMHHLNHPIKYNRALECGGYWELLALARAMFPPFDGGSNKERGP
jgi:hypothetical protein